MWLLISSLALADCADISLDALNRTLDQSFVAYADGAFPLFEASLREAQAALACLTDEIDPPTADRLHFAEALLRHQAGREDAERYLAACCSPARNGPAPYQQLRAEKMPWLAEER